MTAAELKSNFKLTTVTPYLTLTGEIWGVYYEDLRENWLQYNGTALYSTHWGLVMHICIGEMGRH